MTAEELLKQMSVEPFAEEMVCCVIDPETRVIDVPAEYPRSRDELRKPEILSLKEELIGMLRKETS